MLVVISFVTGKKITIRELFQITVLVGITAIGSCYAGNEILLSFIYIYGARDINLDKVFNYAGKIYITIFLMIVLLSLMGIVENWDFFPVLYQAKVGAWVFVSNAHIKCSFYVCVNRMLHNERKVKSEIGACFRIIEFLDLYVYEFKSGFCTLCFNTTSFLFSKIQEERDYRIKSRMDFTMVFSVLCCYYLCNDNAI